MRHCRCQREAPDPHERPHNHEGYSKAMEADSALNLLINHSHKTDSKVFQEFIIADDNSFMQTLLHYETPKNKNGKLPNNIPAAS